MNIEQIIIIEAIERQKAGQRYDAVRIHPIDFYRMVTRLQAIQGEGKIENDGEPGNAAHEFVALLLKNEPLKVRANPDVKRGEVAFDEGRA